MTEPRDREPLVDLAPTRVGGGGSARIAAVVAVVVLGAVVYLGASGRSSTPASVTQTAGPSTPALAVVSPAPRSSPASATEVEQVSQIVRDPAGPQRDEYINARLSLGGQEFLAPLDELSPGYLYAAYRIPYPRPATTAAVELGRVAGTAAHGSYDRYGRWAISLDPMSPETYRAGVVLDAIMQPRPASDVVEPTPLTTNGYRLTVRALSLLDYGELEIEVRVGSDPFYPDESYSVTTSVGRRHFAARMRPVEPGRFVGTIVLPDSLGLRELPFVLRAVPMSNPLIGTVKVQTLLIPLPPPREFAKSETLIDVAFAARRVNAGEAQIVGNGYRLIARSNATKGDRFTEFELLVEPIFDARLGT